MSKYKRNTGKTLEKHKIHLGQTGLGQTGLGQTGLGQTGLGQTGLGQTCLGQTGLGQKRTEKHGTGTYEGQNNVGQGQI